MLSPKRLAQMAAFGRKRVTSTAKETDGCCTSVAGKGHCVMYTDDGRRFEVPLPYLGTTVFTELLRMSREEFGFTSDSRITLPCDAAVMEYVMCLVKRNAPEEVERAFLHSIERSCHNASCVVPSMGLNQHVTVCSSSRFAGRCILA